MSQTSRRCPNCKQLNYGLAEFCQRCGHDIRSEDASFLPWAEHHLLPPIAPSLRDDGRGYARMEPDAAGAGLVGLGLVVTAAGLLIDMPPQTLVILVLIGSGLIAAGLWQLRVDYGSLSRLGIWLQLLAVLSLGVVSWRVIDPDTPNPVNLIQAKPSPTPGPKLALSTDGAMLMHRGGPGHRGTNAGPAPTGSLFRAWRFDTGGELYSSPAISEEILVIGSKSGFLYGLNAISGAEIWSRDLSQYIVRSTPAIEDGTVVVNNGYEVIALSLVDGTTLWTADVSFMGNTSPTIVEGSVFVASQTGLVYNLNLRTGEQRWKTQMEGLIFGSPTVDDSRIFIANDRGKVYAMRTDNGSILWRQDLGGGVFAPIIADDGLLYLTTSTGSTICLDAEFGQEQWSYDAGGASGGAISIDNVVVSSDDGGVSAIDSNLGTIRWLVPTGSQITVGPIIVGNLVLVASGQTLYGFDLATGKQMFTYPTGYTIQISPVVINGVIYIGGRDGFLDAISGETT